MKKFLSVFISISAAIMVAAQSPSLSSSPDTKLPAPKNLKPVTKADLIITSVRLVSATGENTEWDIKISVAVKNSGGLQAPGFKIRAWAQNASASSNPWKNFGVIDFPAVNPGALVTKEIQITDKQWVMHKVRRFNLKLSADVQNQVAESVENNNESVIILISSTDQ